MLFQYGTIHITREYRFLFYLEMKLVSTSQNLKSIYVVYIFLVSY